MSLSDTIKLTLTSQRKLLAIENDSFRIRLNGKHNTDYASILKLLGVTLVFQDEDASTGPGPVHMPDTKVGGVQLP